MDKTEYIMAHKTILPEEVHCHLEMGAYKFKRVNKFKYLGTCNSEQWNTRWNKFNNIGRQ